MKRIKQLMGRVLLCAICILPLATKAQKNTGANDPHVLLGDKLYKIGDYDKAKEQYQIALAINEDCTVCSAKIKLCDNHPVLCSCYFLNQPDPKKFGDKYGYVNNKNKTVIPAVYQEAHFFYDGLARIKLNGKYGYINEHGKLVIPAIFEHAGDFDFDVDLAPVQIKGNYGFINSSGRTVIPAIYQEADTVFSNNTVWIKKDGKYGTINKSGRQVIAPIYDSIESYRQGYFRVVRGGKIGVIGADGKILIPVEFDKMGKLYWSINEPCEVEKDHKHGLYGNMGRIVAAVIYDEINDPYYSNFVTARTGNKWALINKHSGRLMSGSVYDKITAAYDKGRHYFVVRDGKTGLLQKDGEIVVPPIYDELEKHYEKNSERVLYDVKKGKFYGLIDTLGNFVIPLSYTNKPIFREGLANVKKDNKWGFIDQDGQTLIPFEYDKAQNFNEGLAAVNQSGKWGSIDAKNKKVVPIAYDTVFTCFEGMALVGKDNRYGFYTSSGNLAIPIIYGSAGVFQEGLAPVYSYSPSGWGYIDKENHMVIPARYSEANYFYNGKARVKTYYGTTITIDKQGNEIKDK